MADTVFRNGKVVDGTGRPSYIGDVAVKDGKICFVGEKYTGAAAKEINCEGRLIAPGWVDIHTHFDGQITWDPYLTPISGNGVTTIVFGNCGVGFAPCPPDQREFLIELMEGVEDIPGSALAEGIDWQWETFPEYLDHLDSKPKVLDYGALLAQGATRTFVMGKRGAEHKPDAVNRVLRARDPANQPKDSVTDVISQEDLDSIAEVVEEAVRAGAMGFSCSRSLAHRDIHGNPVPGSFACTDEINAVAEAVSRAGGGVFQTTSDFSEHIDGDPDGDLEMRMFKEVAVKHHNNYVTFTLQENNQGRHNDKKYQQFLGWMQETKAEGGNVCAQVTVKSVALIMNLQGRMGPLNNHPTFKAIKGSGADHAEIVRRLSDPAVQAQLIAEHAQVCEERKNRQGMVDVAFREGCRTLFPWRQNYEQDPEKDSFGAMAEREGKHVLQVIIDQLLTDEGTGVIMTPVTSWSNANYETTKGMLTHPQVIIGGSDGGAHVGFIQDAANCTFLLQHWARDRKRGSGTLPLELCVKKQTMETARVFGMQDRGTLEVGMKADVNVIDLETLGLERPRMVNDLPKGARRWIQDVKGYDLTMCSGVITYEHGKATGNLPGRLVRNPRSAAARDTTGVVNNAKIEALRSQSANDYSKSIAPSKL